jgi:NAD(P)-dependent dehydrogenase (short-subunit alcohol dehydrogenase family)
MDNPISLSGKLILVTGASSGIGRATTIVLSRFGARVILSGRRVEGLNETLAQTQSPDAHLSRPFDLSRTDEISSWIAQLVAEIGAPLDGAVHCAGVAGHIPLRALSAGQLESIMVSNVHSTVMLLKALSARTAVRASGSSIVLMSSVAALVASPAMIAYAASKAAVAGIARSAAKELGPKRIRVNCIAPAYVRTPILANATVAIPGFEQIEAQQFLGMIEPEEVAIMAAYLLSDAARRITGSQFVIDGGFTL